MTNYYDRDGVKINQWAWAHLWEDHDYKIVERTEFDQYAVSTVWLGMDHAWGHGPPLIFETLIMSDDVEQCERAIALRFGSA